MSADLATLQSDQSMRDGQLARQGIQTDQFPTATFVLTEPIELGTLPAEGEEVTATAVGDLTLHGVTQSVSIPLGAVWSRRRHRGRRIADIPLGGLRDGATAVDEGGLAR